MGHGWGCIVWERIVSLGDEEKGVVGDEGLRREDGVIITGSYLERVCVCHVYVWLSRGMGGAA